MLFVPVPVPVYEHPSEGVAMRSTILGLDSTNIVASGKRVGHNMLEAAAKHFSICTYMFTFSHPCSSAGGHVGGLWD